MELVSAAEVRRVAEAMNHPKTAGPLWYFPHKQLAEMLHTLDERTVLVNGYRQEKSGRWPTLQRTLLNAGLDWVFLPYNPYRNATYGSAAGIYSNFLRLNALRLVPVFGMPEDEIALRQLEQLFPKHQIVPIDSKKLASAGGLLHGATWAC